jgi:hypothetical protein
LVGYNTNNRRKIVVIPAGKLEPPAARFILPGVVFHRDGLPGNRILGHIKQTRVAALSSLQ